jgi:S-adenosylmethionine synthetase
MVLPGHPDKFCDQVADAILAECYRADPGANGQIEVSVWSDEVWITGGTMTRRPLARSLEEIVRETGRRIGYVEGNTIVADRYQVRATVCLQVGDPRLWTDHVNDQCVIVGWAGYDRRTRFLPPEHFLAHAFRERLTRACRDGALRGHGPDGKLLVRIREEGDRWILEHLLVTLQHLDSLDLPALSLLVDRELREAYRDLQRQDARWTRRWEETEVLVNPNGPFLGGGSDEDNGQTGRKLVMDYYGPRVAIGGGALSGKDLAHIDRAGAYAARQAALHAVESGAKECRVVLAYAPNRSLPLDVCYEMVGAGKRLPEDWFSHPAITGRLSGQPFPDGLGAGLHFWQPELAWNVPTAEMASAGTGNRPVTHRGMAGKSAETKGGSDTV